MACKVISSGLSVYFWHN